MRNHPSSTSPQSESARGDIPHARLHPKQASDFALAISRNDAKRFEDILFRIKGIDSSAFRLVLAVQGRDLNMIEQRSSSPGLLGRILARAPEEVFDWLAGELHSVASDSSSWVVFEGIHRSGALRDPRFISKLLAGVDRSGRPLNIGAVATLDQAVDARRQSNNFSQHARWAILAAEARNLVVEYLSSSNPAALAGDICRLKPPRSLDELPLLQQAVSLAERNEISEGAAAPVLDQRARPSFL